MIDADNAKPTGFATLREAMAAIIGHEQTKRRETYSQIANRKKLRVVIRSPGDRRWFWSRKATHDRGYAASREQAMADFKAWWLKDG